MKKALVTGAAGFIGFHLCSRLLDEEVDVVGIDMAESPDRIDFIARHAGFQYLPQNINEADLKPYTKDCDVIFHLACSIKPDAPWANIEEEVQRHVSILKKVASFANPGTKLIYVSSYDVYGKRHGDVIENSPKNPETLFGLIKLTEENMIKQLAEENDFPYVIMRLPTVYGPGQPEHHTYQQVISQEDERQEQISKDTVTEDVLFVEDAAEALFLAGKAPAKNEIYNISSGKPNHWLEGLTELKAEKLTFTEKRKMRIKGEKAEQELGFRAKTKIKEGIQRQIMHFKNKKTKPNSNEI
ncbi:NAD-dependent epimerase/dehydratase family protein [Fictibacillus phosphorivorans]|uniref:NAD-dependent epimerase/dehydratase family protein n=1 Tax=Fictibacillus phosphorivorans TaxID=1221500 RepID=UPI00204245AC|nr:NAD(P)-dependent oxidoreductase [Fictibacillus phosphorivorans]MCM3719102.1 NAD(P)-dependent oxidoreductase [Fictibacillus phosphorivorans]MCM3776724.1 NAD(P)-dependent oxidoreductase [Fictibacillus phosphorivorans]